ncbi:hypothetical protein GUJ93_ZPchr0012g20713 [Zizania palustris]|uniref:Uncharacterized protein n=1 Tax=Zizania palustris TaxID=103762 RepID=A0A8J5WT77_ZIZPA|nr:hypothetical protein GUJ93_ZPchr0012g20713 [Zizania palustris]
MLLRSSSSPLLSYASFACAAEHGKVVVVVPASSAAPIQGTMYRALSVGDLMAAPVPTVRAARKKEGRGHGGATPISADSAVSSAYISVQEEEEEEEEVELGAAVVMRRLRTRARGWTQPRGGTVPRPRWRSSRK